MRTVAVLAGGLGTRVASLTGGTVPKAMLSVGGAPFIHHKLAEVRSLGAERAVLLLGRHADQIVDYVGDGSAWELKVDVVFDGAELRGTGGALKHAAGVLPDRFWVTYGDTLLSVDLAAAEDGMERAGWEAVMTVLHNKDQWQPSNVRVEGGLVTGYDKHDPNATYEHLDYGYLLVARRDVTAVQGVEFDLSAVLLPLIASRALGAFVVHERFHDIGTPEDVAATDAWLTTSLPSAPRSGRS